MVDEQAAEAISKIIVQKVEEKAPLLAVAIIYETAQTNPAMYLAYQTAEHCMQHLKKSLTNAAVAEYEARVSRSIGEEEHFAIQDRLGDRIGPIFNTGNWINPADPVLLDVNPVIDAWAKRAFQAVNDALQLPEDQLSAALRKASHHVHDTLWHAIDVARRQCPLGRFPPISFVQSVDDYSANLLLTIASRKSI